MATQPDPSTDPNSTTFTNALGQPSSGATPVGTPEAVPAPAAAPGPVPNSYTPQQNGGVQTSSRSPLDVITGQSNTSVTPALQGSLPDAGDRALVDQANAQYQAMLDDWNKQQSALHDKYLQQAKDGDWMGAAKTAAELSKLAGTPPAKPDLGAIQIQSDRARLLTQGTAAYQPLIDSLMAASNGQGPSQALQQYKIASLDAQHQLQVAADDNARRTMGDAASARGTGGQRAAIFQAAMAKAAEQRQAALGVASTQRAQAAEKAAAIGASEQQNARAAMIQALAGQTNVYGTQLYGGTQHQQDVNQDAENNAIALNAKIQENNANNSTATAQSVVKAGATVAAGA